MTEQHIGKYPIGQVVAETASYTAYQAQSSTGDAVLVRVLKLPADHASTLIAGLQKAAQLQAMVRYAQALPIVDAGVEGERIYYVTPFIDAQSLQDRLKNGKPLSLQQVQRLTHETVAVLTAAHSQGVAYRSLKPDNILLHPSGQAYFAELGVTPYSDLMEDAQYSAPELQQGAPPTPLSDVYALGVSLYEMLTGNGYAQAWATWGERFSEVLPEPLAGVVNTAIHPLPQMRHPKPEFLQGALEEALQTLVQRDNVLMNKPVPLNTVPTVQERAYVSPPDVQIPVTMPKEKSNSKVFVIIASLLLVFILVGAGIVVLNSGLLVPDAEATPEVTPDAEATVETTPEAEATPEVTLEAETAVETTEATVATIEASATLLPSATATSIPSVTPSPPTTATPVSNATSVPQSSGQSTGLGCEPNKVYYVSQDTELLSNLGAASGKVLPVASRAVVRAQGIAPTGATVAEYGDFCFVVIQGGDMGWVRRDYLSATAP